MFNIMPGSIKRFFALIICFLISLCFFATNGGAKVNLFKDKKIIVLDPGHGGHDRGARGADGSFEKTITLKLAQIVAARLKDEYRPVLTRTGDYMLDILDRTAVANHLEADLFVSIHTGGSFLHKASGITIYYFKEMSGPDIIFKGETPDTYKSDNDRTGWYDIQKRHITRSRFFAESIKARINNMVKYMETSIEAAPLVVLSGADMPAVIIEIGYISNPGEEKKLRDIKVLSELANAISMAIDNFLSEKK